MYPEFRLTCIATLAWLASWAVLPSQAQTLPEGAGKADFQRICSSCHSLDRATSQRMSKAEWSATVSDMVGRGAQGSSAELENVVTYLSAHFGENSPTPSAAATPGKREPAHPPTEQPLPVVNAAQITHAKNLIQENGCLSCHRIDGAGSYLGPYLEDAGAHRSPEQFRSALISPKKQVAPENRLVQLETNGGQSVTGKLLNQDGFSVQFIDPSGQLKTLEKSDLRAYTIVTANPMPSYANKLSTQDLTDLVAYLGSLRGEPMAGK